MGRRLYGLVFIVFVCCQTYALELRDFINPGVKIGYTFGEGGGMTFGLECSITRLTDNYSYGGVAGMDFSAKRWRFHLGAEISRIIGIEWGPTLIVEGSQPEFGHSLTSFFGVIAYPYFTITFRWNSSTLHEVGLYLKRPIQTAGRSFSLGG